MKTRYVVHHGFFHTFAHDAEPTWLSRQNADRCADIPAAQRDHLIATGVITAIENAPSPGDVPFLSAPQPLTAPEPTQADHASKRKGGK